MSGYCGKCGETLCICHELALIQKKNAQDPAWRAYEAVREMVQEGKKKHDEASWPGEPQPMHMQKASRHAATATMLFEYPNFNKDAESIAKHLKQCICRAAFALVQELNHEPSPTDK